MSPAEAALVLREARESGALAAPFTDVEPGLDASWGYDVEVLDRAERRARGELVVGAKLGLTSAAKQQRMGIDVPVVGFLTSTMLLPPGEVDPARWVQPRVEPEIVFRTGAVIDRALPLADVTSYVDAVAAGAEVLDSRYAGYRFRLPDVLADNTSAAGVVLGPWLPVGADLASVACSVAVDGEVVHEATGAAILGDPWRALVALSEHLADRGESLPAGSVVLAGALTDAVPLVAGSRYALDLGVLGRIELTA